MTDKKSQLDKFKEAARQLETDDDDERFEDRLKKLVKQKGGTKMTSWIVDLGNHRVLGKDGKPTFYIDDAMEFRDRMSAEEACLKPEIKKMGGDEYDSPIPVKKPD